MASEEPCWAAVSSSGSESRSMRWWRQGENISDDDYAIREKSSDNRGIFCRVAEESMAEHHYLDELHEESEGTHEDSDIGGAFGSGGDGHGTGCGTEFAAEHGAEFTAELCAGGERAQWTGS